MAKRRRANTIALRRFRYSEFDIYQLFNKSYNSQEVAIIIDFLMILVYNIRRSILYRGVCMGISYKKLWILLIEKSISPATLRKDLNIATGTMTKMRRNEEVALSVLLRICGYLDCDIGDICEAVKGTNELNFGR